MIPWQAKAVLAIVLLGLAGWAGYEFAWNAQEVKYQKREAETLEANLAATRAQADFYEKQRLGYETARAEMLTTIREQHEKIETLRTSVNTGRQRLLIRAVCPGTPETTAGAGGTTATGAELAADARPAYFNLRAGIIDLQARAEFMRAGWLACIGQPTK